MRHLDTRAYLSVFLLFAFTEKATIADPPKRNCESTSTLSFDEQNAQLWLHIDKDEQHPIRAHCWQRFVEIIGTDESKPGWLSWLSKQELFGSAVTAVKEFDRSKSLFLEHPPQLGIAQPLVQAVHFNAAATKHIGDFDLNKYWHLDELRVEKGDKFAVPFPRNAAIVKSVWWPVKAKTRSPLPVWTELPKFPPDEENQKYPYTKWDIIIWVEPPDAGFSNKCLPPKWSSTSGDDCPSDPDRVVPMDDFYSRNVLDTEVGDIKFLCKEVYGAPCTTDDWLILVGLHISTKELDDWLWMTFWWHNKPDVGEFAADRPDALKVRRKAGKFLMDVAFDATAPREKEHPNRTFNPWLEAGMANGVNSNCITCHQRASWCVPIDNGQHVELFPKPPDAPFYRDRLRLDYVWSLFYENFKRADPPQGTDAKQP